MSVRQVVTVATPHLGSTVASLVCGDRQCLSLSPNNLDYQWLNTQPNPKSLKPVDWTVMGATGDYVVNTNSALNMGTPNKILLNGLDHMALLSNSNSVNWIVTALTDSNN